MLKVSVPTSTLQARLVREDVEVVTWDFEDPQPDRRLDLAVMPYTVSPELLVGLDCSRIGLVQSQALGYDGVADVLPEGGVYANAVGVHEAATAELAMALILTRTRRVDDFVLAQAEHRWEKHWSPGLLGRTVLVVGVGGIGAELLTRLDGFGAHVVRVASRARTDEHGEVHGTDELADLLPTADVVILAVPLNDSTTRLVDDGFLASMREGALLVNVSRGLVVDTNAVVRADGRIDFAADVFDPEPLPAEHPLRSIPGVLITPHVGGWSTSMDDRVVELVNGQIDHLLAGEMPDHVVVRG